MKPTITASVGYDLFHKGCTIYWRAEMNGMFIERENIYDDHGKGSEHDKAVVYD